MALWPHQQAGIDAVMAAFGAGDSRVVLTSPTGMGKSLTTCEIIERCVEQGMEAVVYTNRRMMIDQLSKVLRARGIDFGTRAAGYSRGVDMVEPVQISSLQTEASRTLKRGTWLPHGGDRGQVLAVYDEIHINNTPTARELADWHTSRGGVILGITATPIDLGDMFRKLVVAGTNSEGRACGALVPSLHYGPDEPDMKAFKRLQASLDNGEDVSERQQAKAIMTPNIFGRVWDWYTRLNPDHRPSLLFGPSVEGSLWFAEQFHAKGVSAAHIDANNVWIDGEWYKSDSDVRRQMLDDSKAGKIKVVCNRFILREGIDMPWVSHGILATIFGSLQTYIQSGGRLLRSSPGKDCATVQDHGANWWRHGSLNSDREWDIDWTAAQYTGLRAERMRRKVEKEPVRCPKCAAIMMGLRCRCGHVLDPRRPKSRPVVGTDGRLREMVGDIFPPRRISTAANGPETWKKMYYRSMKGRGERTFRQAIALFAYENNWSYPDPTWPLMPKNIADLMRRVADVPKDRLY